MENSIVSSHWLNPNLYEIYNSDCYKRSLFFEAFTKMSDIEDAEELMETVMTVDMIQESLALAYKASKEQIDKYSCPRAECIGTLDFVYNKWLKLVDDIVPTSSDEEFIVDEEEEESDE